MQLFILFNSFVFVPIVNFLHDTLEESNNALVLLERCKNRTEWFRKSELRTTYSQASSKGYEQVLEDDLRLFLFDQGIEYPFSTPKSASGRADIVADLETPDPLIVEIKIVDEQRNYGKRCITDGITQIYKHACDFDKSLGYLVVFNMDVAEIEFELSSESMPSRITIAGKTLFLVVVNLQDLKPASKQGQLKKVTLTESDLVSGIESNQ